jgi:hypothetical protein
LLFNIKYLLIDNEIYLHHYYAQEFVNKVNIKEI